AVPVTGASAPMTYEQALTAQNPVARSAQALEQGQALFTINCAPCHGADARGTGLIAERFAAASANPPADLTSARVRARTDGELYWIVTNGLGNMPPFRALLTDEQRWTIVQVIRNYQGQ
ncbi:MAG: cytochrome c, partial [Chloroflexi bacterium]|nr:cytochrome c [Chloroflexota bacterium]